MAAPGLELPGRASGKESLKTTQLSTCLEAQVSPIALLVLRELVPAHPSGVLIMGNMATQVATQPRLIWLLSSVWKALSG